MSNIGQFFAALGYAKDDAYIWQDSANSDEGHIIVYGCL
jgi:hypothetical protein